MKMSLIAIFAILMAPFALAAEITVTPSDSFLEELEDNYGLRELDYLDRKISYYLERQFDKQGLDVARVDVTINDARPNKPTFKQLGDNTSLDYGRSIGIGGMDLTATAYDMSGNVLGEYSYDWYETDIRWAGPTTWYDARRAAERFSRKFVRVLQTSE